nr:MAG TPA: rich Immunoreceptor tyrosine-based activation motif [Caudoviricetes sp.]
MLIRLGNTNYIYVLIEDYFINTYIFRIKNHCYIGKILYFYPVGTRQIPIGKT